MPALHDGRRRDPIARTDRGGRSRAAQARASGDTIVQWKSALRFGVMAP